MAAKLTFWEALQDLSEGLPVSASEVQARALHRRVWCAEWHLPGCISESWSIHSTKRDAIDAALSMAEGSDGPPRGMKSDLMRKGRSVRTSPDAWAREAITTIELRKLSEFLG